MLGLRWRRREAVLPLLVAGTLLVGACGMSTGAQPATTAQTTTVQRGTVQTTVNATGAVKAAGDLAFTSTSGGTIKQVLVKVGDRVTAGQPLLTVDTRDLELELQQAEANLASAQAQYDQAATGATDKERADAEAQLRSAEAAYQKTVQGTTTPQDIANAEAALRSAQAD